MRLFKIEMHTRIGLLCDLLAQMCDLYTRGNIDESYCYLMTATLLTFKRK